MFKRPLGADRAPRKPASTLLSVLDAGGVMGKKPRIGLLLAATACLVAVMIDWVVDELSCARPIVVASAPEPVSMLTE
jgi:hypothetical protein